MTREGERIDYHSERRRDGARVMARWTPGERLGPSAAAGLPGYTGPPAYVHACDGVDVEMFAIEPV